MSDTTGTHGTSSEGASKRDEEDIIAEGSDDPITEWAASTSDDNDDEGLPGPAGAIVP